MSGDLAAQTWFKKNGRFSIDAKAFYLFSSNDSNMMPGNVALRYVRIDTKYSKPEDIVEEHARDKIISMYNEELMDQINKQRKGLILSELFAKPRPMWMDPSLIGVFGDAYIEGTSFEKSSAMPFSFMSMSLALQKMITKPVNIDPKNPKTIDSKTNGKEDDAFEVRSGSLDMLYGFTSEQRSKVASVTNVFSTSEYLFTMAQRLLKYPNSGQLMWFLRKLRISLRSLKPGEALLLPAFVEGTETLLFVFCKPDRDGALFRFVIITTDPNSGLKHHDVSASNGNGSDDKIKFRSSMVLDNVSKKYALDDVFWMVSIFKRKESLHRVYENHCS